MKILSAANYYEGEIVKIQSSTLYGIVVNKEEGNALLPYAYEIVGLSLSKYRLFRKIQLWILKKTIQTMTLK
jgi:hypothetical protein